MKGETLHNRIVGCILAGALGDAMGGPYEGCPGPLEYRPPDTWAISDDTQLTLATCEAVTNEGRVDPQAIADRFLVWFRERRITGIGGSTLKALRDLDADQYWALCGARGEMAAGNGAAMRIAPLAFVLNPNIDQDRTMLRDICRITHHNDEAYLGALAIVLTIRAVALSGRELDDRLPAEVAERLPDSRVRDRLGDLIEAHTRYRSVPGVSGPQAMWSTWCRWRS